MLPALFQMLLRLHRLGLRAYPRNFRAAFEDEMQAVFAQALTEAAEGGAWPAAQFIAREWLLAPGAIAAEHWRAGRQPRLAGSALQTEAGMATRPMARGLAATAATGLILLGFLFWLALMSGWGSSLGLLGPALLGLILMAGVWAWALTPAFRRWGARPWAGAALLCLAGLAWPTDLVIDHRLDGWPPLLRAGLFMLPAAALIVAAGLLTASLAAWKAPGRPRDWRAPAGGLLSALVVGKVFHNLYWLMVWDATYDPLGFLWIIPAALAALFGGIVLATAPQGNAKWAGLYGLLIPALLWGLAAGTQNVNFRQMTVDRAARVARALEAYYAREGRFPNTLSELSPWYLVLRPQPIIINGQDWCYQGGEAGYQLGYVDREHWSSPELVGQLAAAAGPAPAGPPLCAAEITALRQPGPYFSGGWSWPFPAAGVLTRIEAGMSRAQVLERVPEVWHRDSCAPQRPTGGSYALTDLFWTGARDVTQATVSAVHYEWALGARVWAVTSTEIVARDQLYDRYSYCATLDLTTLAGLTP